MAFLNNFRDGDNITKVRKKGQLPSIDNVKGNPYTQGFESIYSLEEVDVSSIKKLGSPSEDDIEERVPDTTSAAFSNALDNNYSDFIDSEENLEVEKGDHGVEDCVADQQDDYNVDVPAVKLECDSIERLSQLELKLGLDDQSHLDSWLLDEPIEVLRLSEQALRGLKDNGQHLIKDILSLHSSGVTYLKGMGQGHLDEAYRYLEQYLSGRKLYNVTKVDFSSLVRCICGDLDRISTACLLEQYGLKSLVSLNTAEDNALRHMKIEQKHKCIQDIYKIITSTERVEGVKDKIDALSRRIIKPWMRMRLGLANIIELQEKIDRIGAGENRSALAMISSVYFQGELIAKEYLYEVDQNVYGADKISANYYKLVVNKALSYFYRTGIKYVFDELVSLLLREFARECHTFPENFISKALRLSPRFHSCKNFKGVLMIRRS